MPKQTSAFTPAPTSKPISNNAGNALREKEVFLKETLPRLKLVRGFTLIETLAFLFIFSVVAVTFYTVFGVGMRHIAESKNRLGAVAVANEKMEIIRNLSYNDVGVVGGIPNGTIPSNEDVVENTKSYHVTTFVQYIDDSFDGTLATTDTIPNDYKRVKVTVSWGSGSGQEISMVSRFVPPGLEMSAGDGILAVNVIDSLGSGVAQSNVQIVNNAVSPAVSINTQTDNTGNLMFPGAEASLDSYEITVSKGGYETVATVDPASVSYVPTDAHASVISGAVTMKSIVQDQLSDVAIESVDYLNNAISNVNFHLEGGRVLGTSGTDKTYQTDMNTSTNGSGEFELNATSPGGYFIDAIGAVAGYTLIGIDAISSYDHVANIYGISVPPNTSQSVKIKFANNIADSLLVKAVNDSDGAPLNGAQVRVTNDGTGYDVTQATLSDGVAFFPHDANPFTAGSYTVEVQAAGFQTETVNVNVSQLTTQEIRLTAL